MRLKTKISLVFITISITVIILITLFNYQTYLLGMHKHMERTLNEVSRQINLNLDQYVQRLSKISMQPLYDHDDEHIQFIEKLLNQDKAMYPDWKKEQELEAYLDRNILLPNSDIMAVHLWAPDGFKADRYKNRIQLFQPAAEDEKWYQLAQQKKGELVIAATHLFPSTQEGKSIPLFSIYRQLNQLIIGKPYAALILDINLDKIADLCNEIAFDEGSQVVLVDQNNHIMYSSNPAEIASSYDKATEKEMIIGKQTSSYSGWTVITSIPLDSIKNQNRWVLNSVLIIALLLFLVEITISSWFFRSITKPFNNLQMLMKNAETGQFYLRYQTKARDEIYELGNSFNRMLEQIEKLINSEYVAQLRQKDAEFKALQSQINPHFLFNTLEAIRMTAEIDDNPKIAEMISSLGLLLQENIRQRSQITLKEELNYISHYFILESMRLPQPLNTQISCDEGLHDAVLPPLIIQPIVENAIKHGIKHQMQKGSIYIEIVLLKTSVLCIRIEDNGVGLAPERLDQLRSSLLHGEFPSQIGIGICNVHQRIVHLYGKPFGLTIESEIGQGTVVTIQIPYIRNGGTEL